MKAVTHRLGGISVGIILAQSMPGTYTEQGLLIGAAVLGSLLPDIDHHNSYISHKAKGLRVGVGLVQGLARLVAGFLPSKQEKRIKSMAAHRGLAHSLLFAAVVAFLGGLINKGCAIGLAAGIISHLVLDMFSGGVPLFMPVITNRICIARIKTGGVIEWGIRVLWVLIPVGIYYKRFLG